MDAKQVPLRELLASVPADARLVIDDADGKGTRFIPVGRLCQEAAAALAEQRLTDMEQKMERSIESLKTALAEPEGGGNLPPPLQEPKDFDHGIGADRFKVVRGAFWWHVLIGDSPTEHGKFRSRASAEKMAADLLREFRNGAFVQHEAALAEPVQEPVAWSHINGTSDTKWHPPQRKPLTEEEIWRTYKNLWMFHPAEEPRLAGDVLKFARAIERAHGIT